MLSSLDELGRAGYTAIGDSAEEAAAIYEHVQTTLIERANDAVGGRSAFAVAA